MYFASLSENFFKFQAKKVLPIRMYTHFWQFLTILNHKKAP